MEPSGHSLVHFGPGLAPEPPAALKKWMKEDRAGTRYAMECDIHHCFDELDPAYVMNALRRLFKDWKTLCLCEAMMEYGVLIGAFFSAWFLHLTLQPLDLLIHQREYGVTHYLRQMDNFTVFSRNKRKLRRLLRDIREKLGTIGLKLNGCWQVYPTVFRKPSALGYRFGHGFTIPRKHNLFRLKRGLHGYYYRRDRNRVISFKRASSLISRRILERIYQPKTMSALKKVVRKETRRLQKLYPSYGTA